MNEIILSTNNENGATTMSSVEMVNYINAMRPALKPNGKPYGTILHKNFIAKVAEVLGASSAKYLAEDIYTVGKGASASRLVYHFPKREATLMAMSYSSDVSAAVYDAMEAAEAKLKGNTFTDFEIPTSFSAALMLAAKQAETIEAQTVKLTQQAPAVEFHKAVVADDKMYQVGDAAKILGVKPRKFFQWLREEGYLRSNNTPYAKQDKFLQSAFHGFVTKTGVTQPPTTYVTSEGLAHFQWKLDREYKGI